jgi:hypothetical protein
MLPANGRHHLARALCFCAIMRVYDVCLRDTVEERAMKIKLASAMSVPAHVLK